MLRLPPLREQQAIVATLGAIDDKIELNRRMNETLEAMARALFKNWFIDFGPVRAKMEGRQPPGLSPEIAALFPDRLDEEGKPEGWQWSRVGDQATVLGGSTPSTKQAAYWAGGHHNWATPKDLSALASPVFISSERCVTDAGLGQISSGLLPVGTLLLSSRAPIGYLAIAEVPTAINQGFIAIKCEKVLSNIFMLFWCKENMGRIAASANGSTFQEISKSNFRPISVLVPTIPILQCYDRAVAPLYRSIVSNIRENEQLVGLRNMLLPRLLSGDLHVRDATSVIAQVA
jgi:type I restriction enzyme S subunit